MHPFSDFFGIGQFLHIFLNPGIKKYENFEKFSDIIMYNTIKVNANSEKFGKSAKNDEFSNFVKNYSSLSKSEQLEIRSISWAYDRIDERKQKVNELNHEAFLEQKITKLPDIVIGMILELIQNG